MNRLGLVGLWAVMAASAPADVIFDTYGNWGNGINDTQEYGVYTPNPGRGSLPGIPFTATGDYRLTSIELPLSIGDLGDQMTICLRADDSGNPGALLESFLLTNTTGEPQRSEIDYTFDSTLHPQMMAGETYFVTCEPVNDWTDGFWYTNSDFTTGPMVMSYDSGANWLHFSDGSLAAIRVRAQPVPEPLTLASLTLGAGLLWRRRQRLPTLL